MMMMMKPKTMLKMLQADMMLGSMINNLTGAARSSGRSDID